MATKWLGSWVIGGTESTLVPLPRFIALTRSL